MSAITACVVALKTSDVHKNSRSRNTFQASLGTGRVAFWRSKFESNRALTRCEELPEGKRPVTVYITGFGPFGSVLENPTSVICGVLRRYRDDGVAPAGVSADLLQEFVDARVCLEGLHALEVSASACRSCVKDIFDKLASCEGPAALVHLGVASGRLQISLECRGVNEASFRIPDAQGLQVMGERVVDTAEEVIYTTLRLPELLAQLHDRGVPSEISTDAGRYICNYLFFTSLHSAKRSQIPVLFVHVPEFLAMDCSVQVSAVLLLSLAIAQQLRGEASFSLSATSRPLG